ncbi:type III-A CRISPR-associated RAMP protein Csm4 [Lyngbya aestuarii]|uniref:type III-A CRISPR-associated RAMP protein Csm4 n=1 Tax=Lyngbya aestuarii TaxID=118322 RepID=UPI00403DBF6D
MITWKLVRLNFEKNPVHFGELGIGLEETAERVSSDTLFSAWINAYVRLFGGKAVENLLQQFLNSPPVRMSSTFIYRQQGDEFTYYLPRPLAFPRSYPKDNDLAFFKTYKKLNYLPLKVWQRWYQGEGFTKGDEGSDRTELTETTYKSNASGDLHDAGVFDYGSTFKKHQLPKVAVDRVTRATNFYHTGFVHFENEQNENGDKKHSGLYFLLQFPETDEDLENRLHTALNLLGEEGLGGERSSGAGRFKVDCWSDLPFNWREVAEFKEGNSHCLISLFWQKSLSSEFLTDSSYEIIERGGWIGSPFSGQQLRRKKVRMFAEGSVFSSPPSGQLADVTPERFNTHAIYRNGISLSLPILIDQPSHQNSKT